MPGSGLKVCGGWWVGGVQTHFSDQPKSQADQQSYKDNIAEFSII